MIITLCWWPLLDVGDNLTLSKSCGGSRIVDLSPTFQHSSPTSILPRFFIRSIKNHCYHWTGSRDLSLIGIYFGLANRVVVHNWTNWSLNNKFSYFNPLIWRQLYLLDHFYWDAFAKIAHFTLNFYHVHRKKEVSAYFQGTFVFWLSISW